MKVENSNYKVCSSCKLLIDCHDENDIIERIEKLVFSSVEDAQQAMTIVRLFIPRVTYSLYWHYYLVDSKNNIIFASAHTSAEIAKRLLFSIIPISYASKIKK